MQDAQTQEINLSTAIHLAFEILEPGNVPFNWSSTPWFSKSCMNGIVFFQQTKRKTMEFLDGTRTRLLKPLVSSFTGILMDHVQKTLAQLTHGF